MSASALADDRVRITPATARPYLVGGLAALSVGAAAIHFAVTFEHYNEYVLYGVFFLIISWAQLIWAAVLVWRPSRLWLSLGMAGNALVLAVYVASRSTGLPIGPDVHHPEPVGGLDVVTGILEFTLIAGCAALLWRPSLADRPVRRRSAFAAVAAMLAVPAGRRITDPMALTSGGVRRRQADHRGIRPPGAGRRLQPGGLDGPVHGTDAARVGCPLPGWPLLRRPQPGRDQRRSPGRPQPEIGPTSEGQRRQRQGSPAA